MLQRRLLQQALTPRSPRLLVRPFTSSRPLLKKNEQYPARIQIPDADIKHSFVLGSGPGGQVINKTASAAQLTHLPTGIVVKSQQTRSRTQNYKIARQILADRVDEHLNGKDSRSALKQERKSKKKQSADKKKRRKYRQLEEDKTGEALEAEDNAGANLSADDGGDASKS